MSRYKQYTLKTQISQQPIPKQSAAAREQASKFTRENCVLSAAAATKYKDKHTHVSMHISKIIATDRKPLPKQDSYNATNKLSKTRIIKHTHSHTTQPIYPPTYRQ
jgi:hypothetical protein